MKHPECGIKSCTDEKPTGSCLRYHEGLEAGRKAGDAEGYARAIHEVVAWLRDGNVAEHLIWGDEIQGIADAIERGEHNRGPGSLARGDNPDPTPERAPVKGTATHGQGASPEAANVAKPQHDPASAPASCARSSLREHVKAEVK